LAQIGGVRRCARSPPPYKAAALICPIGFCRVEWARSRTPPPHRAQVGGVRRCARSPPPYKGAASMCPVRQSA